MTISNWEWEWSKWRGGGKSFDDTILLCYILCTMKSYSQAKQMYFQHLLKDILALHFWSVNTFYIILGIFWCGISHANSYWISPLICHLWSFVKPNPWNLYYNSFPLSTMTDIHRFSHQFVSWLIRHGQVTLVFIRPHTVSIWIGKDCRLH